MASILADTLLRARPVFALPRTLAIDPELVETGQRVLARVFMVSWRILR
jgi:hypothetical protein